MDLLPASPTPFNVAVTASAAAEVARCYLRATPISSPEPKGSDSKRQRVTTWAAAAIVETAFLL